MFIEAISIRILVARQYILVPRLITLVHGALIEAQTGKVKTTECLWTSLHGKTEMDLRDLKWI